MTDAEKKCNNKENRHSVLLRKVNFLPYILYRLSKKGLGPNKDIVCSK